MTVPAEPRAATAPRVVAVRLSGLPADINAVAALLVAHGPAAGITVGRPSAPRVNRRDPGARTYLTVLVSQAEES